MKVFKFSGLIDDTDRNVCNEFIGYFILQEHGEIIGVMKGKKEQSVIKGWFSNKKLFFTEVTGKKHSRRTGHYRSIHGLKILVVLDGMMMMVYLQMDHGILQSLKSLKKTIRMLFWRKK